MPHFIIDCSQEIIQLHSPEEFMKVVNDTAEASGLFKENDIEVRVNPHKFYKLGHSKKYIIHVFGNIVEGRTIEQRQSLSKKIIEDLNQMFS